MPTFPPLPRPPDPAEVRDLAIAADERAMGVANRLLGRLGAPIVRALDDFGRYVYLVLQAVVWVVRPPWRIHLWMKQMEFVGWQSLPIIVISGMFTGMVFALQSAHGFSLFGAEGFVGPTVVLALTLELSPVLSALMIAGRAGSAMAAEIGTMKVTEQVDALLAMAVNPINYLVSPRVVAGVVMLPIMTMVFNVTGTFGAWLVTVKILGFDEGVFIRNIEWYVDPPDIHKGLIKAVVFGFIISTVGCYKGFYTTGGAEGVGRATTQSVVIASVAVLIADYFLTKFLLGNM